MKTGQDFQDLLNRIQYPGFQFEYFSEANIPFLRVKCEQATDNTSGEPTSWNGRKWRLSRHMTDMEVVNTAFLAVMTALEHEARELFKVDDIAVMDSHRDLDQLVEYMKTGGGHGRAAG